MDILIWVLFGGLVGVVASMVMGTGGGLVWDVVVGVVGAVIGGYVMNYFGKGGVGGFNFYSFLVALLGACILIVVLRMLRGG